MSNTTPFLPRVMKCMTFREKLKLIVTVLLCLTVIIMVILIRAKDNTIRTLQQEIIDITHPHIVEVSQKPDITVDLIVGELKSAAELSTAELSYTGVAYYMDGKVPFLTKKAFYMIYHADVRAGIDFDKFNPNGVTVTDEKITVTLPKIEIFEINIKEDKIVFVDDKKAMFNPESKEDVMEAIQEAKNDLNLNLDAKALMLIAAQEADIFVELFLRPYLDGRTLEIKYQ